MDQSALVTLFPCHHHPFCQGHLDPAQPHHGSLCPVCFATEHGSDRPPVAQPVECAPPAHDATEAPDKAGSPLPAKGSSLYRYPVQLHFERGRVRLLCPDVPEVDAVGDTMGQVIAQGLDSLKLALALYVKRGRSIPLPSETVDPALTLPLSMMMAAKILLWNAMCEERVSRAELARRMGCTRVTTCRLVDFLCASKIGALEDALNLLGRRLTLVLEAA